MDPSDAKDTSVVQEEMKENGIPQKILNFANESHNFEADSGKPIETYIKDALLEDAALGANHVLGMLRSLLAKAYLTMDCKMATRVLHTLCTLLSLHLRNSSVSEVVRYSFSFMSIIIPFQKQKEESHNDSSSNTCKDIDGGNKMKNSTIAKLKALLKSYGHTVRVKMETETKAYIDLNNSDADDLILSKRLPEVKRLWETFLDNNEIALTNVILLASTWKHIILVIQSFSQMLEQNDSKEYDRLILKTIQTSIKNCKEIFTIITAQLKAREDRILKEGGDPAIPASLSEKNLSSVTLLRYHQLKLKELVEVSSSRTIFQNRKLIIEHIIESVSFVHPIYGVSYSPGLLNHKHYTHRQTNFTPFRHN